MEPEQLHGILVFWVYTYSSGLGAVCGLHRQNCLLKPGKSSRRVALVREGKHPPQIQTSQTPSPATFCHLVPPLQVRTSQQRKLRFVSNHICTNKGLGKDEVYRKGNALAHCRKNFIRIF